MKLLKLLPLLVFLFAFNLYAQSEFFGSEGTKYYSGVLVKTEDGKTYRAIVEPIISHENLLKKIQEQYGRIVEILWMGELKAVTQENGKTFITRVNETAGAIDELKNGKEISTIVDGVTTTAFLSTRALHDNPGLGIKNLKAFNDAKANVENISFVNTDYISYDNKHLDERLKSFSLLRHAFPGHLKGLSAFTELYQYDNFVFMILAPEVLKTYESVVQLDPSFDTQEWKTFRDVLKPVVESNNIDIDDVLKLVVESGNIKNADIDNVTAAASPFLNWFTLELAKRQNNLAPYIFSSSENTPRSRETFAKALDYKKKFLFENFNAKKMDDMLRELNVSYTTLLRWNEKIASAYDTYMRTGELPNKYLLVDKETESNFAKTLDAKKYIIFKERVVTSNKKTLEQLAMELETSSTNVNRWEDKIISAYDEYLKNGELPNKYALLDSKALGTFANEYRLTSLEKYILYFRIASSEPMPLSEITKKFTTTYYSHSDTPYNPPYNNLLRKEQKIKSQLDVYVKNADVSQDEEVILDQYDSKYIVTTEEVKKVNDMLLTPEEIKFDAETIDLFKRYINHCKEFNPNAAVIAEATLVSANIPVEDQVAVETGVYVPKGFEYNEKNFRETIIPFLVRNSAKTQSAFKGESTDTLAKMAIQLIVEHINNLNSYDLKALMFDNGVLSYLENRVNNLAKGTDSRMAYVFTLDIFLEIAEAKGPAYLAKVCKVDSRDFSDTKARIDLIVKEQSADPKYKAKFLDKTGEVERYEKLKRLNSSTFKF